MCLKVVDTRRLSADARSQQLRFGDGKSKNEAGLERHHEIPNCYMGEHGLSSCGLLGNFCHHNFPIYKRTNAGRLDPRQLNLPRCDSWQALPF
jgi:hypothetical protein